ncbi:hypothetical protein V8C44DRAFT_314309 [Trichoderma aethiopicum]
MATSPAAVQPISRGPPADGLTDAPRGASGKASPCAAPEPKRLHRPIPFCWPPVESATKEGREKGQEDAALRLSARVATSRYGSFATLHVWSTRRRRDNHWLPAASCLMMPGTIQFAQSASTVLYAVHRGSPNI